MSRPAALAYLARVRDDPVRVAAALKALYAVGLIDGDEPVVTEALERQMDAAERGGRAGRVLVARNPPRHDGAAVVAVVVRTDATDVLFHHVGPVGTRPSTPALADEHGTRYSPAHAGMLSESGYGFVTVGSWRYLPAAPAAARRFTIGRGDAWWIVGE